VKLISNYKTQKMFCSHAKVTQLLYNQTAEYISRTHIECLVRVFTQEFTYSNKKASSTAVLPAISVRLAAALTVVELGMGVGLGMGAPTMFATA